jgi:hypothetical protein
MKLLSQSCNIRIEVIVPHLRRSISNPQLSHASGFALLASSMG